MMSNASPEQDAARERIGRSMRVGIGWTTVGSVLSTVLRLLSLLVLARLLSPAAFGLAAKATTVLVFTKVVGDLGLGGALVQHQNPSREHVRAAFTVSLAVALVLAVVLVVGAPWIASSYRSPALVPVLRALAIVVVARGIGSIASQLSRRAMDFRTTTIADLLGYLLGTAVTLVCAVLGIGFWSLIIGYMVETLFGVSYLCLKYPPPRLGIELRALRELLRYGVGETVTQIANVVATQGDYVIVGRSLGEVGLGSYTRAYELVRFPANVLNSVVGTVFLPGMARLQDDPAALATAFRRVLFSTSAVLLPASAALLVLAPEFLHVILGPQWGHTVVPFQILVAGMLFRCNYKFGALVARARGDTYGVAVTQIVYALCVVGGALFASRWGIAGVSASTTLSIVVVFVALTWLGLRHTGLSLRQAALSHAWGGAAMVVVFGAEAALVPVLRAVLAPAATLGLGVGVGAFITLGLYVLAIRRGGEDWRWMWETLRRVASRRGSRRRRT